MLNVHFKSVDTATIRFFDVAPKGTTNVVSRSTAVSKKPENAHVNSQRYFSQTK